VRGWPAFVIRRGQVVLANGECMARPGQGQWVRRAAAGSPSAPGRPAAAPA